MNAARSINRRLHSVSTEDDLIRFAALGWRLFDREDVLEPRTWADAIDEREGSESVIRRPHRGRVASLPRPVVADGRCPHYANTCTSAAP